MPSLFRRFPDCRWFAIILAVAWALRIPGLQAAMFQDEVHILQGISHLLSHRTFIPMWFDWPPLFSYAAVPPTGVAAVIGGATSGLGPSEWALVASAFVDKHLIWGARVLSLLLSGGVLALLWAIPDPESSPWARVLAVIGYVFSPVAVEYAAYGLPEEGVALSVAGALLFSVRYLRWGNPRSLLSAGVFVGLGGAFKYNGAIAAGACIMAAVFRREETGTARFRALFRAGLAAIIVFLVLTPTWVLVPDRAAGGFLWESGHVGTPRLGPNNSGFLAIWPFLASHEPIWPVATILAAAVLVWRRRDLRLALPVAVMGLNWLAVGGWTRMDPNYWYPSLPAASVAAGLALTALIPARRQHHAALVVGAGLAACLFAIRPPVWESDNADRMSAWLAANLPGDAVVYREGTFTTKVWDAAEVAEFTEGRGRNLSAKARAAFEARLAQSPRAARVVGIEAGLKRGEYKNLSAEIESGAYLMTTSLPIERVLAYPSPDHPQRQYEHAQLLPLYESLVGEKNGWRRVHAEEDGSGQRHYLWRKVGASGS